MCVCMCVQMPEFSEVKGMLLEINHAVGEVATGIHMLREGWTGVQNEVSCVFFVFVSSVQHIYLVMYV